MTRINIAVDDYFPCIPIQIISTCCAPFTLGLSLLIPFLCITDAKHELQQQIDYANRVHFNMNGLHMQLVVKCLRTSWLEIIPLNSYRVKGNKAINSYDNDVVVICNENDEQFADALRSQLETFTNDTGEVISSHS